MFLARQCLQRHGWAGRRLARIGKVVFGAESFYLFMVRRGAGGPDAAGHCPDWWSPVRKGMEQLLF